MVRVLADGGFDCAGQEAAMLLQHATHQSPVDFYSNLQREIGVTEASDLERMLARRLNHEPLQYILGSCGFYGRDFHVDSRVLIPRPESELLIEVVREVLRDLPRQDGNVWLADVGTGSASLAITLACEFPLIRCLAVDKSGEALRVARTNVSRHSCSDTVHLLQGDLVTAVGCRVSAIVANLPYVRTEDIECLIPEVSRFEPREALDGGVDGLSSILRLCEQAPRVLLPGGRLLLEVGDDQAIPLMDLLSGTARWDSVTTLADLRGVNRVLTARLAE